MVLIEQLSPEQRREFFDRILHPESHPECRMRRKEFNDRFEIATDSYDTQIAARIGATHHDQEVVDEMVLWAVGYFNLWKRCARKIAVAYKRKPRRRIDKDIEQSARLTALYAAIGFDAFALMWQRMAVIMNRVIVLVVPRLGEEEGQQVIDFEFVTGADTEVIIDPRRSIYGVPDIIGTKLKTSGAPLAGEAVVRTVDARAFIWWDAQGNVARDADGKPRVLEHGLGTFPGADMLSEHQLTGEWWDWKTWRAATRATIEVGMIGASMGWTRKTQCRKIIALLHDTIDDEGTPDGQNITDHERPLKLRGLQFLVNDLNTSVNGFLEHIRAIQDEQAEQMTGTSSTFVDPDPKLAEAGVGGAAQHGAIREVRESQITNLDRFEVRMAYLIATLATRLQREDAVDPKQVRKLFRCAWAELAFLDTPKARLDVWTGETTFGISDQVEAMMEKDGISEEEAVERLEHLAKRRAKLDALRAARNQTADPTKPQTTLELAAGPGEGLAEVQGRRGGAVDAEGNPTEPEGTEATELGAGEAPAANAPAPKGPDGKPIAAAAAGADVQALALNGAQMSSLMEMATAVAEKRLPLEFIARLLPVAIPVINESTARRLLEPLAGFEPAAPEPAAKPGGPPFEPEEKPAAPDDEAA